MSRTLWVTWEEQRRNEQIAKAINATFRQIVVSGSRLKRYLISLWGTLELYHIERPDTVICQNPSVVLALTTVLAKKWFKFKVGVDSHNAAFALDTDNKFLKWAARFIQRHADFIIAHNEQLKDAIKDRGGNVIVLPDKIPTINEAEPKKLDHKHNLLFICSFAKDEPFREVFRAAELVSEDIGVYVTGRYQGRVNPEDYSSNVHFLGRIPWDEFDAMLYSVDGVIELTTRENCLLCGAYESVAVEKPLVLTNTVALKSYFNKGAVYTDNDRYSIARSMHGLVLSKEYLTKEVKKLKVELQADWEQRKQGLLAQIGD